MFGMETKTRSEANSLAGNRSEEVERDQGLPGTLRNNALHTQGQRADEYEA